MEQEKRKQEGEETEDMVDPDIVDDPFYDCILIIIRFIFCQT